MLRTIMVGVDGSKDGDAGLHLAIRWAKDRDALLVGFTCIDEPGIHRVGDWMFGEPLMRNLNTAILAELQTSMENALSEASRLCIEAGVAFKPLEDVGSPHVRLLEEAQRYDMIVMGGRTHFRFGAEESPDSTLSRVLAASPRPVMVVPRDSDDSGPIAVAYDGSAHAARALQAFEGAGIGVGREIHVLSIEPDRGEAARCSERATEYLRFHGLDARPFPVASDASPGEVLLETIREHDAALVVMGACGRSAVSAFFLGSTTRWMLDHGDMPMFLFH